MPYAAPRLDATRAPAPVLPAMDELQSTHRELLEALDRLATLLDEIDRQGSSAAWRAAARSVTRYLDEHARSHHAEEERLVFPALLDSGDIELVQHVRRLQQDHGWLEEDWLELGPQLDALAHGIGGVDLASLRAAAEVFSQLYRDHIALEETVVYPEARRLGLAHPGAAAPRR